MASAVIRGVLVTGTAEELNQLINLATTQVTISGTTTYGKDYRFSAKREEKLYLTAEGMRAYDGSKWV